MIRITYILTRELAEMQSLSFILLKYFRLGVKDRLEPLRTVFNTDSWLVHCHFYL